MTNNLRILLAEYLLRIAVHLAPSDTEDGRRMLRFLRDYADSTHKALTTHVADDGTPYTVRYLNDTGNVFSTTRLVFDDQAQGARLGSPLARIEVIPTSQVKM